MQTTHPHYHRPSHTPLPTIPRHRWSRSLDIRVASRKVAAKSLLLQVNGGVAGSSSDIATHATQCDGRCMSLAAASIGLGHAVTRVREEQLDLAQTTTQGSMVVWRL
jgi:hypothetical protein